jgi:hypothetical protein
MERQYIITAEGYIVAEYVGEWMENELRDAAHGLGEDACRLMFPEALAAWETGDDSRVTEADDLSAIDEARGNMENEKGWAMPLDEYLDYAEQQWGKEPGFSRSLATYHWTMGQNRGEGGGSESV